MKVQAHCYAGTLVDVAGTVRSRRHPTSGGPRCAGAGPWPELAIIALTTVAAASSHAAQAADDRSSGLALTRPLRAAKPTRGTTGSAPTRGSTPWTRSSTPTAPATCGCTAPTRACRSSGGDLVVHQSRSGRLGGRQPDARPATSTSRSPPPSPRRPPSATALAPSAVTRRITGDEGRGVRGSSSTRSAAPRAWPTRSSPAARSTTAPRAGWRPTSTPAPARCIRTEQQIETVDGSGQSLYGGTVPLQLTLSGSTYQLKDPTRGGTYTTDMGNAEDSSLCQCFGSGCKTGTLFTSPDTSFGNGTTSSRESAAVDAQYGTNETWDYYKPGPRPQRHLRHRQGLLQPGPLRQRTTSTPSGTAPR